MRTRSQVRFKILQGRKKQGRLRVGRAQSWAGTAGPWATPGGLVTVLPSGCPCLSFGALSSLAVDAGAVGARRGRPLLGADMELRPGGGGDGPAMRRGGTGVSGSEAVWACARSWDARDKSHLVPHSSAGCQATLTHCHFLPPWNGHFL